MKGNSRRNEGSRKERRKRKRRFTDINRRPKLFVRGKREKIVTNINPGSVIQEQQGCRGTTVPQDRNRKKQSVAKEDLEQILNCFEYKGGSLRGMKHLSGVPETTAFFGGDPGLGRWAERGRSRTKQAGEEWAERRGAAYLTGGRGSSLRLGSLMSCKNAIIGGNVTSHLKGGNCPRMEGEEDLGFKNLVSSPLAMTKGNESLLNSDPRRWPSS